MNLQEIKYKVISAEYEFLRSDNHLGKNVVLLGLGGSHAYGTNVETSDVDIRGCALNSKKEILTNENFECFTNKDTDTTIYSFNKLITLLSNCNPNTIELLGLKPEHYIHIKYAGQQLLDNKKMFLSKKAIYSFGGYANSQLRRLENKTFETLEQSKKEEHIINTIKHASYELKSRYFPYTDDEIKLYIDNAVNEDFDKEIFMDINLNHYPLRDYKNLWSKLNSIVKEYSKIGKRNENAMTHDKLAKHMMHLVRLYIMCFDILEKGEIVTFRENEHDFLMDIRNGKYLDENDKPISEFYETVNLFEERLKYASKNTDLPDKPDYKKIQDFVMSVNEMIVKEDNTLYVPRIYTPVNQNTKAIWLRYDNDDFTNYFQCPICGLKFKARDYYHKGTHTCIHCGQSLELSKEVI